MPKYFKKRSFRKKPFASRKRKPTTRPSKKFTKMVQKIVHKDAETKQTVVQLDNVAFNSGISSSGDVNLLVDSISQGTDDGQRIGSSIRGQKLQIKGHMQLVSIPTTNIQGSQQAGVISPNCRVAARLMMVQPKSFLTPAQAVAQFTNWGPYLLDNGVATQAFIGNTKDLYLDLNRDQVTVMYDKVHYLNISQQYTPGLTSSSAVPMTGSTKFFQKTINLRNKLIRFGDLNNQPTNYAPVILIGYAHIDGTSPDTLTTAIQMSYVSKLTYEDI